MGRRAFAYIVMGVDSAGWVLICVPIAVLVCKAVRRGKRYEKLHAVVRETSRSSSTRSDTRSTFEKVMAMSSKLHPNLVLAITLLIITTAANFAPVAFVQSIGLHAEGRVGSTLALATKMLFLTGGFR